MLILLCFQIKILNYYEITKRKTAAATAAQTAVHSALYCSRLARPCAAAIFICRLSIKKLNFMAAQNSNATANIYNNFATKTIKIHLK